MIIEVKLQICLKNVVGIMHLSESFVRLGSLMKRDIFKLGARYCHYQLLKRHVRRNGIWNRNNMSPTSMLKAMSTNALMNHLLDESRMMYYSK